MMCAGLTCEELILILAVISNIKGCELHSGLQETVMGRVQQSTCPLTYQCRAYPGLGNSP